MAATTKTDAEFCQEIIDLIDGTHWIQGDLEDFCWVPTLADPLNPPEGAKLLYEVGDDEYTDYKPDSESVPVLCMEKARYCLVGMVIKVAGLKGTETSIDNDPQAVRIIDALHVELPELERVVVNPEVKDYPSAQKIIDIEHWNDKPSTNKEMVRSLVVASRDNCKTKEQADGSIENNDQIRTRSDGRSDSGEEAAGDEV